VVHLLQVVDIRLLQACVHVVRLIW
jgi:hypothetical protein